VVKKVSLPGRTNFELRVDILNALDSISFIPNSPNPNTQTFTN
jgi:hypothetical protein